MTERKVFSGHQPNFLPYMGLFYKLFRSDVFIIDDDVQYNRKGNTNANFIKVNGQKYKMIVPVKQTLGDKINDIEIAYDKPWAKKLLKTIEMNYRKADHFEEGYEFIERHLRRRYRYLVDLNVSTIREIAEKFGLDGRLVIASTQMPTSLMKNDRNVWQCKALGCNVYYSGVGGKEYNDEQMYADNGIEIVYTDYVPLKYKQLGGDFIENLSVLDYVMNEGFVLPESWKNPLT